MAKRVLAVDDNEDLLSLLRDLFSDEGYDYVACSKPRDAYQTARTSHPDLVLLDVAMPSMNGWEVLNLFVLDPQLRHLPIVLMTAAVADAERRLAKLNVPDISILAKPFDVDRLLAHIDDALHGPLPAEELIEQAPVGMTGPVLVRDET